MLLLTVVGAATVCCGGSVFVVAVDTIDDVHSFLLLPPLHGLSLYVMHSFFCIRISIAVKHGQTCCLTLPSSTKHNHGICKQQEQHQS